MRVNKTILLTGIATLLLLFSAACEPPLPTAGIQALPADTSTPAAPPATATPSKPEKESSAVPTLSTENVGAVEKAVAAAKTDLAQRLDASEETIIVKSVKEVQWRDSSLGCPQPGMMYAQVITPGFQVVLEAKGKNYEYHTDTHRAVLCDNPNMPSLTPVSEHTLIEQKEFPMADFDPSLFLFVEVQEERTSQSKGGQTTSFEGEMTFYHYDEENGIIEGEIGFPIDESLRMVVGKWLTTRIGDNRASSSLLYAYPAETYPILPIIFSDLGNKGRICFSHQDTEYCLDPGESTTLKMSTSSSKEDAFSIVQQVTLAIINHGFLEKDNLVASP